MISRVSSRNRRRSASVCAALVSTALLATGCHVNNPYQPTDPTEATKAAAALTSLPSLEDTQAQVEAAIVGLGGQITAIAPTVLWEWRFDNSRTDCNPPFEQSDGEEVLLRKYVSDTPVPEQSWGQVFDVAKQVARSLGATNLTVFKDAPNNHDVQFTSDTGTTLRFGSQSSALLTGTTGCRLPAAKK